MIGGFFLATKRDKKRKASQLVRDAFPSIPAPIRKLPSPLRIPAGVLQLAELGALGLIQVDPLGIITDDNVQTIDRTMQVPGQMELSRAATKEIINSSDIKMNGDGVIDTEEGPVSVKMMVTRPVTMPTGREVIARSGQFSRANILPRNTRTRKKTKTDRNMSLALREANKKFRKANGKLRKGATQAQIMRYAHKLLKRM